MDFVVGDFEKENERDCRIENGLKQKIKRKMEGRKMDERMYEENAGKEF